MKKIKFKKRTVKIFFLSCLALLAVSFYPANAQSNIQFTCEQFRYPWCDVAGSDSLADIVNRLYVLALGVSGASAFAMFVYGAILYTVSGAVGKKQEAMDIIKGAIYGVVLLLGAYLLLKTIDADLVNLGRIEEELSESAPEVELPDIGEGESIFSVTSTMGYANLGGIYGSGQIAAEGITMSGGTVPIPGENTGVNNGIHRLSGDAAMSYNGLNSDISAACQRAGYSCNASITSTLTGDHLSQCHQEGNIKSGTCADFVIKGCSDSACLNAAFSGINGSRYVTTCLNEYAVDTPLKTGNHVHCNFATSR